MHNKEKKLIRPPIITIAGHIDHGKTTLINKLTNKKNKEEFGGITQNINGYNIKTKYGNMTFIDTPGHLAFSSLRKKIIKYSDIMLLVVAIDDGIKEQTIEAINIAKNNNIPIIICVNKIDKEHNENKLEKLTNELSKFNLIQEKWGGDTFFCYISAKTGIGIENLLDTINIQADLLDLKTNTNLKANGIIIDNKIDSKKGNITSIIIKNGILKIGDIIKTVNEQNKIKSIIDENKNIKEATPSMYVDITGLQKKPEMGIEFKCINKNSKKDLDVKLEKNIEIKNPYKIEDIIKKMNQKNEKKLNLIIKVDLNGTIDVLKNSINKLSSEKIKINLIKIDIGTLTQSDIELADATKSQIITFNLKTSNNIIKISKNKTIKISSFNIIYDLLEYINKTIEELINPEKKEIILGIAEVKKIFNQENKIIAGCTITQGKIKNNSQIKIIRKNNIIYKGIVESLQIFKNQVQEVTNGNECGIIIKDYKNLQINDKIKSYSEST